MKTLNFDFIIMQIFNLKKILIIEGEKLIE